MGGNRRLSYHSREEMDWRWGGVRMGDGGLGEDMNQFRGRTGRCSGAVS